MIENAIGRRGIIGFFLGGAAAAVTNPAPVTIKAAAEALGVSTAMSGVEITETAIGPPSLGDIDWGFINAVERNHYARRRPVSEMPPHISTKKSWSHTYKASVFAREDAIMAAYVDKLRSDRSFLDKMKAKFFGGDDSAQQ